MSHSYQFRVIHLADRRGNAVARQVCEFQFANHDDLGLIIERASRNAILPEKDIEAFCVGLKLLTEVVMVHRNEPAFAEFWPHLGTFIRSIKAVKKSEQA